MTLSSSRLLSLIVMAIAYIGAWPIHDGFWLVTLGCGPILLLIWFPEEIDDFTYGAWVKGAQIDSHTPGVLIAAVGWIVLVLFASAVFFARYARK
jgi:uncharacterized membrane protein YoaT (DUF817 family)